MTLNIERVCFNCRYWGFDPNNPVAGYCHCDNCEKTHTDRQDTCDHFEIVGVLRSDFIGPLLRRIRNKSSAAAGAVAAGIATNVVVEKIEDYLMPRLRPIDSSTNSFGCQLEIPAITGSRLKFYENFVPDKFVKILIESGWNVKKSSSGLLIRKIENLKEGTPYVILIPNTLSGWFAINSNDERIIDEFVNTVIKIGCRIYI